MTDNFKQIVSEIAKGLNFPQNAVVMCTAIDNEETQNFDLTAHFDGEYYVVSCIMRFLIEQYLKPFNDEQASHERDIILNLIVKDEERRR